MTTNNNEGQEVVTLEPAEARITLARKNDLVKVMRKIDKSVDKAVEFLESVMLNEEADLKTRITAAQFIVDKKIQMSESISKDQLARTIGEARMLIAEKAISSKRIKDVQHEDDDEGYATPKFCPDVIIDHSSIKNL